MWAFVVGLFGGRVLRDGRTPDSVKQARWDARRAGKAEARSTYGRPGQSPGFVPIVVSLGALCLIALVVVAVTR